VLHSISGVDHQISAVELEGDLDFDRSVGAVQGAGKPRTEAQGFGGVVEPLRLEIDEIARGGRG
jgi:hypothetical protein